MSKKKQSLSLEPFFNFHNWHQFWTL